MPSADDGGGKRGWKRRLVVLAVILATMAAGSSVLLGGAAEDREAGADVAQESKEGEVIEVEPLTVNLAEPGLHYARVGLGLVLAEGANAEEVTARLALLKDVLISTVASFRSRTLVTVAGQEELRRALTRVAHEVYGEGTVLRVVLTELVVQ
ncbi:MAG TPA: flagellar basal body-associated FliL family protein [Actinomycetota bacterium]|nr:flagellar basal body-associated FliL family protein [Actinomycetota bacterium]